jgi:hypothetical protein
MGISLRLIMKYLGITLTFLGTAWYGKVELDMESRTPKLPTSPDVRYED